MSDELEDGLEREVHTFYHIRFGKVTKGDLSTPWISHFSAMAERAKALGIKNARGCVVIDAIVLDAKLYIRKGPVGKAEINGESYLMIENSTDYMVVDGKQYVRSHEDFEIVDNVSPEVDERWK